jgi:hypothetical protein
MNETCAQCQICPCPCASPCDHNCECFASENQHPGAGPSIATSPVRW